MRYKNMEQNVMVYLHIWLFLHLIPFIILDNQEMNV
jgi:hypothetical protein